MPITLSNKRVALLCVLQALQVIDDDPDEQAVVATGTNSAHVFINAMSADRRHGTVGINWQHIRNDNTWFFKYALQPEYVTGASWKALFRIPHGIFERLLHDMRSDLTKTTTNFRSPLPPELRLAAFLMYSGGATCEAVGNQLGIGPSTVSKAVNLVSRAICSAYDGELRLPTAEQELAKAMDGFAKLRGLPYCVGAVDGTHIPWPACPEEQYYEYRCYKGFTSIVVFAVVTADRRFIYADVGRPGVLGDSTIYSMSSVKKKIDQGTWLGQDIPDLVISDINVRPYLIGDCAFTLDVHMMKSSSKAEMRANPVLKTWDIIASQTRKPVECAFGMLKQRFKMLKDGVKLHHEDDISYLSLSCLLLHNLCIDAGDEEEYLLPLDEPVEDDVVSAETSAGKKQRDALLYYTIENLADQQS